MKTHRLCARLGTVTIVTCMAGWMSLDPVQAQESAAPVPATISSEAQAVLGNLIASGQTAVRAPEADDLAGWQAFHDAAEPGRTALSQVIVDASGVTVSDISPGGVPAVEVIPDGWTDDGRVIVYIHGGAFTMLSARSTIGSAALMASATGIRTVSIEYPNPPAVRWDTVQERILAAFAALREAGYAMDRIGVFGDSAGGNLVVRTVLNLRDAGEGMPAAVVLFSPWADLTDNGDTAVTLRDVDPTLSYENLLAQSARAYAGDMDLSDPRVSPIHADFAAGFPPTLIQEGTRTIFLSTSIRLYRALRSAGVDATIDMYEGMWHVFQSAPIPETRVAIGEAAAFMEAHF